MNQLTADDQKRHTPKYAAIYIRVSRDKQEDNYSLETQKEGCLKHAAQHGYIVEEQNIYQEIKSGAIYRERPVLTALRAAARRREFNVVIVYDLDRLSRDAEHQTILMEDLAYNGVKVECVLREIEDTAEGKLMLNILGYTATIERERIRERTMRGRRARAEIDKKLLGQNRARYGFKYNEDRSKYLINDDVITVDENDFTWTEAEVVKYIFRMSLEGVTIRRIAKNLTSMGIPTKVKRKNSYNMWSPSTVQYILKDPCYTGKAEAFKYVWLPTDRSTHAKRSRERPEEERILLPEGTIPSLIDEATFQAVQERLQSNKKFASRNTDIDKMADTFLRCGFIECGFCGNAMSVKRTLKGRKGRQPDVRYRCNKNQRGYGLCPGGSVAVKKLNQHAWQNMIEVIRNPTLVEEAIEARRKETDNSVDELAPIEKSIASVERKMKNYKRVIDAAEDDDVIDDATAHLSQLAKEKRKLEKEKSEALANHVDKKEEHQKIEKFKQWCVEYRMKIDDPNYNPSYEEKIEACQKLGVKVIVWNTNHEPHFLIGFNFGDIVSNNLVLSQQSSVQSLSLLPAC
jgi:site-specific DNA recombinase